MRAPLHMLKHEHGKHKEDITVIRQKWPHKQALGVVTRFNVAFRAERASHSQREGRKDMIQPTPSKHTSQNTQVSKQSARLGSTRQDRMSHLIKPKAVFNWSILWLVRLRYKFCFNALFFKAVKHLHLTPLRLRCLVMKLGQWRRSRDQRRKPALLCTLIRVKRAISPACDCRRNQQEIAILWEMSDFL